MRNLFLGVSFVALSVSFSPITFAEPAMPSAPQPIPTTQMSQDLGFTPDQQTQFNAMKTELTTKMAEDKIQLQKINDQITTLAKADVMDEPALDALITQKKEIMGAMMRNKAMMKSKMYHMLTPEQKVKLDVLMKKREMMMNQHPAMPN